MLNLMDPIQVHCPFLGRIGTGFVFLVSLASAHVTGCVPIPTLGELESVNVDMDDQMALATDEAVVVLSDYYWRVEEDSLQRCVREEIERDNIRVLSLEQYRDEFSPWLEQLHALRSDDDKVPGNDEFSSALMKSRLRHLISVGSTRSESETDGLELVGIGFVGNRERYVVDASVFDIVARKHLGVVSAEASGAEGYAHVMLYGVMLISATETTACSEVGRQISDLLNPSGSSGIMAEADLHRVAGSQR